MKNYLITTVAAEIGYTHNHSSNLYSKEDIQGSDYEKYLPIKTGKTKTIIEMVENCVGIKEKWVTTITKIS